MPLLHVAAVQAFRYKMKIASWNVNSIKARKEHVKKWLTENQPDLLMIQELKGVDFPKEEFEEIGYKSNAVTQKAYNGVAIFSKEKQDVISTRLYPDQEEEQARFIEIDYQGLRVINIYLPNGNPVGTEKYDYKINWLERLITHLQQLRDDRIPFIIGGDFNIIPEDQDCHDPNAWKDDALFLPKTLEYWSQLKFLGLYDAFRMFDSTSEKYSFWDYQAGAWPQNKGIRIDHFLLSPTMVDKATNCWIDPTPRGWEKASDHTPIILEIDY